MCQANISSRRPRIHFRRLGVYIVEQFVDALSDDVGPMTQLVVLDFQYRADFDWMGRNALQVLNHTARDFAFRRLLQAFELLSSAMALLSITPRKLLGPG